VNASDLLVVVLLLVTIIAIAAIGVVVLLARALGAGTAPFGARPVALQAPYAAARADVPAAPAPRAAAAALALPFVPALPLSPSPGPTTQRGLGTPPAAAPAALRVNRYGELED
jgi:hypothetical protein